MMCLHILNDPPILPDGIGYKIFYYVLETKTLHNLYFNDRPIPTNEWIHEKDFRVKGSPTGILWSAVKPYKKGWHLYVYRESTLRLSKRFVTISKEIEIVVCRVFYHNAHTRGLQCIRNAKGQKSDENCIVATDILVSNIIN